MVDKNEMRNESIEKEYSNEETQGKNFTNLSQEDMEKLQGQGDATPETTGALWDMINSTGKYVCRK